jgi:hypothetical protein
MSYSPDKLEDLFELREQFMTALQNKVPDSYPAWPVNPTVKENQIHVRDMALRGVEEMFEALQHLKNSKPHRQTDMPDFDKDAFLEETVDAFNYFLTVLVLLDVTPGDLHTAYKMKHEKILCRLQEGY